MTKKTNYGGEAGEQLRSIIERVERLNEEVADLKGDIGDIFLEAKGNGFDPKTIRQIIKLRALSEAERTEQEAMLDLYMHALGMLTDTPLGDAARQKLSKPDPADEGTSDETPDEAPQNPVHPEITQKDMAAAKKAGAKAARDGVVVLKNPYVAGDPRRAAWDFGWCGEIGSDGMDIPKAYQRNKPKKTADDDGGDA
jgi:uncharacterized protein (UPF0335 family)